MQRGLITMQNQHLLIQISAAKGPVECCRAVSLALVAFEIDAFNSQVKVTLLETIPGPRPNTLRSALIFIEGKQVNVLAQKWSGSVQWINPSTFRLGHKRKNWFIGVTAFTENVLPSFDLNDVKFETMRSSGPGGQHVNKTESAVRATHLPSGISVRVETERSQHANKNMAVLLLKHKLEEQEKQHNDQQRNERWLKHYQLERGNPVLTFIGESFKQI